MGTRIEAFYLGTLAIFEPEARSTGIFKRPALGPLRVTRLGLEGDVQADRRVHGGEEKALHHYPAEHYRLLASFAPQRAALFVPGSIGENFSTTGWTEENVCLGDVFRIGGCLVQVSQPRTPCWKIDRRYEHPELSRFIARQGVAGWYYRVLEEGIVAPGTAFELVERNPDPVTLRELWAIYGNPRPERAALARLCGAAGLSSGWREKLAKRLAQAEGS